MPTALDSIRRERRLAPEGLLRPPGFGNPMSRLVFLRQIYSSAVRSIRLLSIIALAIGGAFVVQATYLLRDDARLYDLIELILVRNIAPLAAAIIIIGRSATSIATELALMRCTGETEALRLLRIPARGYLVVPRVAAVTLATVGCGFYCQLISVLGGFVLSSLFLDVQFGEQLGRLAERLSIGDLALDLVKSACFGALTAGAACSVGLGVAPRMEEVALAPARAFLRALLGVFAIDMHFVALQFWT